MQGIRAFAIQKVAFLLCLRARSLARLRDVLMRVRPPTLAPDQCWLHFRRTESQNREGKIRYCATFTHDGIVYHYTVNLGFIAVFVEGRLDDSGKDGITNGMPATYVVTGIVPIRDTSLQSPDPSTRGEMRAYGTKNCLARIARVV